MLSLSLVALVFMFGIAILRQVFKMALPLAAKTFGVIVAVILLAGVFSIVLSGREGHSDTSGEQVTETANPDGSVSVNLN
jgi:hypothetical protein